MSKTIKVTSTTYFLFHQLKQTDETNTSFLFKLLINFQNNYFVQQRLNQLNYSIGEQEKLIEGYMHMKNYVVL